MTDEQLAANYSNPALLSNVMLAAAITDEDIETYIKFSYNNGANVWRNVLAEAARRVRGIRRQLGHGDFDETVRRAHVVCDMWEHYEHAREKHPYFCDIITCLSDSGADTHLDIYRSTLAAEANADAIEASTLLFCEFFEAMQAYTRGDKPAAVEECYDCIAVLLRVIDVLEGRQKLGKPEGDK